MENGSFEHGIVPIGLFTLFVASLRTGGWESLQGLRPLPELVAFGITLLAFWSVVGVSVLRHGPTRERVPMSLRELWQWVFVWGSIVTAVGATLLYGEGLIVEVSYLPAAAACVWMYVYERRKRKLWPYSFSLSFLFGAIAMIRAASETPYLQSFTTAILVCLGITCVLGAVLDRIREERAYGSA